MIKTKMKLGLIGLLCLFISFASCKKEEENVKKDDVNQEGLLSTTGDQQLEEDKINSEVVFHRNYSNEYSEAEIEAMWQKDLKEFMASQPCEINEKATPRSIFYHRVRTRTSDDPNSGTDGNVKITIKYQTSTATLTKANVYLDNPGDDRERGDTDYYYIKSTVATPTHWVRLKDARIYLQGTDGWKIDVLEVKLHPDWQIYNASGESRILSFPNVFLDNNRSEFWDSYYTDAVESPLGYLWFL